jgi:hypothetical protein
MLKKGRGRGYLFSNKKNSHNLRHFDLYVSPSSHPYPCVRAGTGSTQSTLDASLRKLIFFLEQQMRAT